MALKSGPCGRCVRLTRGETAHQSGADMRLHNHGIATTPAPREEGNEASGLLPVYTSLTRS
eukprot:552469-Prymnesium_polylepis.1